jgi:predicted unusual protein kinase regulating ubiquinone biosynthesis (AarF/ABC1/UbiB family)
MEHLEGTKVDRLGTRFASGDLQFEDVMERLTGVYLRMMMVEGFLHADPHPGNLLVADDGTIVILDWGMVLDVPRWSRDAILSIALAVEREELDGVINGMYRLGMISPEVSRSEIRDGATEIMRIMERARLSSRERVQEVIQQLWDAFYTWPLLLPQELVYFFRAALLLEGIGFRYDPDFNGLLLIRRVVRNNRAELLRETAREPIAAAKDLFGEVTNVLRSVRELLQRTESEELRVRVHPRDAQAQERFLHLLERRFLLSIFATATAVISAIIFVAVQNLWLLGLGLGVALVLFVIVFFIPTHLLENPLRHARGIRPR